MGRKSKFQLAKEAEEKKNVVAPQPSPSPQPTQETPPSSLKDQLSQERGSLLEKYQEDKANETPKRGRPRKEEVQAEQERIRQVREQADNMAGFVSGLANIVCERLPNPKPLSDMEKATLESAASKVIEKYWERVGEWSPEVSLVLAVGFIIYPRVKVEKTEEVPAQ